MDAVVIISLKLEKNILLEKKIEVVLKLSTFREIFDLIYGKYSLKDKLDATEVDKTARVSADNIDWYDIDFDHSFSTALSVVSNIKHLQFQCNRCDIPSNDGPVPTSSRTIMDVLIRKERRELKPVKETNNKQTLHNKVLHDIQVDADGKLLVSGYSGTDGHETLKLLTNVLWHLDGRYEIIISASKHRDIPAIPKRFYDTYTGFHDWVKAKHKPRIDLNECGMHALSLVTFVSKRMIHIPEEWKNDILELSTVLSAYETYLSNMNEQQKKNHESLIPIRHLADHVGGQTFKSVEKSNVKQSLLKLSDMMKSRKNCEYMMIDDDCFETTLSPAQRHETLKNIFLEVPVQVLRYDPGGGIKVLLFIQRIPELMSQHEISNALVRFHATVQPKIPIYHTRAMRGEFVNQVKLLSHGKIPSHVSRNIYRSLTGDSSTEITNSEIDKRVQLALDTNDPDLIVDLRNLNSGRPGDTFQVFFDELAKYVEEITAADERHHGVAHMSEFLSLRDMIERVSERVPHNTPIPSPSTVKVSKRDGYSGTRNFDPTFV